MENEKYMYPSGKIVTRDELFDTFQKCHPEFKYNQIEFEMNLYIGIQNVTLKVVE